MMKNILLGIAFIATASFTASAQDNKNVEKRTTIKKVTTRGTTVETKVVKATETKNGVVVLEGNKKEDQAAKVITKKNDSVQVVKDTKTIDQANTAKIEAIKKKKEEELRASIAAEKAKAEKVRKVLEEKERLRLKEVKEKNAQLTKRKKGMAKLKKEN